MYAVHDSIRVFQLYNMTSVCGFSVLQASFVYMFRPSDSFYARPFGLTIDVYYKDAVGHTAHMYKLQQMYIHVDMYSLPSVCECTHIIIHFSTCKYKGTLAITQVGGESSVD